MKGLIIRQIMFDKVVTLFTSVFMLTGCVTYAPEIQTLCMRDEIGNYIIKWEADPTLEGVVKIYVSDNPESFTNTTPSICANINDGVATYITRDNITRNYFRLTFNDKYPQVVGSRALSFDHVQNIRDLGGYQAPSNKHIRWGKVYRSGDLFDLKDRDFTRLQKLGIKTIIDLRGEQEIANAPIRYSNANIINIPIPTNDMSTLPQRIKEGRMRKRDALVYMQDEYLKYITDYNEQFSEALKVFTEKENYPILFNCSYGKDRVGFLAAILLTVLGVPEDVIIQDYKLSSEYIDFSRLDSLARSLSFEGQEAVTLLLSSPETFIAPTLQKIKKEYGSVDNYISKELHLTEKEAQKIKDILLY